MEIKRSRRSRKKLLVGEFGGGYSKQYMSGFVCSASRYGSTISKDRSQLNEWLNSNSKIKSSELGEIVDAHYCI